VATMSRALRRKWITTAVAWLVACLVFFPIFWMLLTGFKTEVEAVSTPPSLFFRPTFENYVAVQGRANYFKFAWNSIFLSVGSTLLALLIAVPAAYAMAFFPTRRTKGTLMWMLSTKFMPAVGVLVPIYLLFRDMNLLDEKVGLLIVYTLINLPIVVWMLFSFFKEVPREILEAGRMDGAVGASGSRVVAMVEAAESFAQKRPSGLEKEAMKAVSGAACEAVRLRLQNASFQDRMMASSEVEATPGSESGRSRW